MSTGLPSLSIASGASKPGAKSHSSYSKGEKILVSVLRRLTTMMGLISLIPSIKMVQWTNAPWLVSHCTHCMPTAPAQKQLVHKPSFTNRFCWDRVSVRAKHAGPCRTGTPLSLREDKMAIGAGPDRTVGMLEGCLTTVCQFAPAFSVDRFIVHQTGDKGNAKTCAWFRKKKPMFSGTLVSQEWDMSE